MRITQTPQQRVQGRVCLQGALVPTGRGREAAEKAEWRGGQGENTGTSGLWTRGGEAPWMHRQRETYSDRPACGYTNSLASTQTHPLADLDSLQVDPAARNTLTPTAWHSGHLGPITQGAIYTHTPILLQVLRGTCRLQGTHFESQIPLSLWHLPPFSALATISPGSSPKSS